MSRFRVGRRVTARVGWYAGCRGRTTQRAHRDVRPYLRWVVTFDQTFKGHAWAGFNDKELSPSSKVSQDGGVL